MADKTGSAFLGTISTNSFNNDYTFIKTVGQGGFGEVYKVLSMKDDHIYAVKKVRFDQHKRKNKLYLIKRELINNAKLSHENVVRYYDSWVEVSADQFSRTISTDSETDSSRRFLKQTSDDNEEQLYRENSREKWWGQYNTNNSRVQEITPEESLDESNSSIYFEDNISNDQENTHTHKMKTEESESSQVKEDRETGEAHIDSDVENSENDKRFTDQIKSTQVNLPDFKRLNVSSEDTSDTSLSSNSLKMPRVSSGNVHEALSSSSFAFDDFDTEADIVFDEAALSGKENDSEFTKRGEEYVDDLYNEFADEEDPQASLPSGVFAELLEELSKSVSGNDILQPDSTSLTDGIKEIIEDASPRYLDLYIKMEFCDLTLREAIDNGDLVNNDSECWSYFKQIVKGLSYIHSKGITHRDLKPRNVFITNEHVVKIGDFGLSRLHPEREIEPDNPSDSLSVPQKQIKVSSRLTGGIGTVWYTAPEALGDSSCNYGQEVDLFSLGLIFFEMNYVPLKTEQEKAAIFTKLRDDRLLPDNFSCSTSTKERQTKIIKSLLDPNPKTRLPLSKLLSPAEGYIAPEPLEEIRFKTMLSQVLSNRDGEMYIYMMQQLYNQRTGRCWPSFQFHLTPTTVIKMRRCFMSVAEKFGAKQIDLPLFMPPQTTDSEEASDYHQAKFLDSKGNPVILSDSALAAFCYALELKQTISSNGSFYNTESVYTAETLLRELTFKVPQISYFTMANKDDMLAFAKALLILQETLTTFGHEAGDFIICLTHKDIENGLMKIYDLTEKEQWVLNQISARIGDTTLRLKVLKELKKKGIFIPEILAVTGNINKMVAKLEKCLGQLHRSVHGFNEELSKKIHETLAFLKQIKTVIEKIGVSIDLKLELFMQNPQIGLTESGINFRMKSKSRLLTIAKGGQYAYVAANHGDLSKSEFLWFELDPLQIKETDIVTEKPDVVIVYDKTKFDDVKNIAFLCGKLTSIGLVVSEIETTKKEVHISPYCKFLIHLDQNNAIIQYAEESKLKKIPMKLQTAIHHIKQRSKIPCVKWLLS